MPVLWIIIHFTVAGLLAALVNWIGLIPWRRAANAHWTEQARLLYPVRFTARLVNAWVIPLLLIESHALCALIMYWPDTPFHYAMYTIASFLGGLAGGYPLSRETNPGQGFFSWCHQLTAVWGSLAGIWAALFTAAMLMPVQPGWRMAAVAAGYLIFHFLIMNGLILRYLRLIKFMKPAGPRLRGIVAGTSARIPVRLRGIWQLGGVSANAVALPLTRELIFTDRLLNVCTDEEVSAICAHELAHLTESKSVLARRLLGSLALLPLIFMNIACQNLGWIGLLLVILGMGLIVLPTRYFSQRMEKRADQIGRADEASAGVYAAALEKSYRENQTPAVNVNNRQTHPHLYDRLLAAGKTPDYPRPASPRRLTLIGWGIIISLAMVYGVFTVLYNSLVHGR